MILQWWKNYTTFTLIEHNVLNNSAHTPESDVFMYFEALNTAVPSVL